MNKVTLQVVRSMEVSSALLRAELASEVDNISPVEKAGRERFIGVIDAAEKMADAIEAAEDSRYSMTDAGKAAWEFRKAMRGDL